MKLPSGLDKGIELLNRKQKLRFLLYLAAGVLLASVDAIALMQIQVALEAYNANKGINFLGVSITTLGFVLAIGGLFLFKNLVYIAFNFMKQDFLHKIQKDISLNVYRKFLTSGSRYFSLLPQGTKVSYATTEPLQVVLNTYTPFMNLVIEAAVVVLMISTLLVIKPVETLIIGIILVSILSTYQVATRKWLNHSGECRKNADAFRNEWVRVTLNGILQIRALATDPFFLRRFEDETTVSCQMVRNKAFVTDAIKNIIELAVLVALGIVALGLITSDLANLVAFIGVFAFAAYRMMPSLNRLLVSTQSMRYGSASLDALHELLMQPDLKERLEDGFADPIALRLNVKLLLGKNDHVLIRDRCIELKTGDFLVIKGPSGIGKSTLAEAIILGDQNIDCSVNGEQIFGLASRKNMVSFSGQVPMIFPGSLAENLLFNESADERVSKLIEVLGDETATSVINRQGTGNNLNRVISDKALSGGQLARIDIMRALLAPAHIYMLDEPTSALDAINSRKLAVYLKELSQTSVVIVITHDVVFDDLSTQLIELQ